MFPAGIPIWRLVAVVLSQLAAFRKPPFGVTETAIWKSSETRMRNTLVVARWLPFIVISVASLWASAQTTQGYRDPIFDWDISWPAIANALTKMPHIGSMFMIFLLGALAVAAGRLWLAALLTFLVGIGWEVVQMPTIGNNPRLADLAPDLVGIGIGWLTVALGAMIWRRVRPAGHRPKSGSA